MAAKRPFRWVPAADGYFTVHFTGDPGCAFAPGRSICRVLPFEHLQSSTQNVDCSDRVGVRGEAAYEADLSLSVVF